ncbi:hypothetical protein Dsin_020794 [Dipteronia sinensis]|uniref:PPIase cyclophilin-type domain-containing protein n=1 Tax=Dipteronia sinensis TaxID=43782 RepID=A0AAE0AB47_9ROSI|nr:hypothetical protein Dsin_020794 [Dipteronia sinensis]
MHTPLIPWKVHDHEKSTHYYKSLIAEDVSGKKPNKKNMKLLEPVMASDEVDIDGLKEEHEEATDEGVAFIHYSKTTLSLKDLETQMNQHLGSSSSIEEIAKLPILNLRHQDISGNDMFDDHKNVLEKEVQFANVNSDIFNGDTTCFEKIDGQTVMSEIRDHEADGEADGETCVLEKADDSFGTEVEVCNGGARQLKLKEFEKKESKRLEDKPVVEGGLKDKEIKKNSKKKKNDRSPSPPAVQIWEDYPEFSPLSFQPDDDILNYVRGNELFYTEPCNSYGAFMLKFSELMLSGHHLPWKDTFGQKDIPTIQKAMALDIFNNDTLMVNLRVFFDISICGHPEGRTAIEFFSNSTPITSENFPVLCTGEKGIYTIEWLNRKQVVFGHVVEGFDVLKAVDKIGSSSGLTSKPVMVIDYSELCLNFNNCFSVALVMFYFGC